MAFKVRRLLVGLNHEGIVSDIIQLPDEELHNMWGESRVETGVPMLVTSDLVALPLDEGSIVFYNSKGQKMNEYHTNGTFKTWNEEYQVLGVRVLFPEGERTVAFSSKDGELLGTFSYITYLDEEHEVRGVKQDGTYKVIYDFVNYYPAV